MATVNPATEIALPFSIGPDGGVAQTYGQLAVIEQHIATVILTEIGERVMLPTFGSNSSAGVFEPNDDLLAIQLEQGLQTALQQWIPELRTVNVTAAVDPREPSTLAISVNWSLLGASVQTTTVQVGGNLTTSLAS